MPRYVATIEATLDTAQYRKQDVANFPSEEAFVRHMAGLLTEDLKADSDGVRVVGVRRRTPRKPAPPDPQAALRAALGHLGDALVAAREARRADLYDAGEQPHFERLVRLLESEIEELRALVAHYDQPRPTT